MAEPVHPADTVHPSGDNARRASEARPGDFFTRLAERALGIAPQAQPVLAPVYAPAPGISVGADAAQILIWNARQSRDGQLLVEHDEWVEIPADPERSDATQSPRQGLAPEASRVVQTLQDLTPGSEFEVPVAPDQPSQARVTRIQPEALSSRPVLTGNQTALQPGSPGSAALAADGSGMGDEARGVDEYNSSVRARIVGRLAADQPRQSAEDLVTRTDGLYPRTDGLYPRLLVPLAEQPGSQTEPTPASWARRAPTDRDNRADTLAPRQPPPIPGNLPDRRQPSQVVQPVLAEPEAPKGPPADDLDPPDELNPLVRITIGRVEVRAVQPPPSAPARPAPRKAPALSLDDYLKQRNEARR